MRLHKGATGTRYDEEEEDDVEDDEEVTRPARKQVKSSRDDAIGRVGESTSKRAWL